MQFLIYHDSFIELTPPIRPLQPPRLIPWGWIIVSICGHILMVLLLVQFATSPEVSKSLNTASKQRPIIAAELMAYTRVPPTIKTPVVNTMVTTPVTPPVMPTNLQPIKPTESPNIEPRRAKSLPAETMKVPEKNIALPQHSFSFTKSKPAILTPSQSQLLSNTTTRAEVQAFFNTFNSAETQEDAQQEASNFATAQISPELFAGAPALTPAQQYAKEIYDAKIDVDCSSGVNKVLATISQFTLHAVVCQDKGNIDVFIQQRLAGKDSRERLQGLQRKQQN
ncbi:MAG TPA: hypothetical protein DCR37_07270 [Glaciecola sp.]|nr:hypothetical protein [Glaciecola sp.]